MAANEMAGEPDLYSKAGSYLTGPVKSESEGKSVSLHAVSLRSLEQGTVQRRVGFGDKPVWT